MTSENKTGTIAWSFLKRNPDYKIDQEINDISKSSRINISFHHFSEQQQSDTFAQKWGLFAYKDPSQQGKTESPFWSIPPLLDAEIVPNSELAILPMLRKTCTIISGLLLLNGDLILKIEHDEGDVQIRIMNGRAFSETSGLMLKLPLDLRLPIQITRSLDFWNITSGKRFKKLENATKQILTNFSSFLTVSLRVKTTVR